MPPNCLCADNNSSSRASLTIGPWGEVLAHADHDEPGVIFAELDLDAVGKARAAIPALANARPFAQP